MTLRLLLPVLLTLSTVASAHGLTLRGPVATSGDPLPRAQVNNAYGCSGGNRSPLLRWYRVPPGAKSLAVTVIDLDAPSGAGWWHWVVYDIPPGVSVLPGGAGFEAGNELPRGARQAANDFGQRAFGGACPPKGDAPHRYVFTLYALDVRALTPPEGATAAAIAQLIYQHRVAQSAITAVYAR